VVLQQCIGHCSESRVPVWRKSHVILKFFIRYVHPVLLLWDTGEEEWIRVLWYVTLSVGKWVHLSVKKRTWYFSADIEVYRVNSRLL